MPSFARRMMTGCLLRDRSEEFQQRRLAVSVPFQRLLWGNLFYIFFTVIVFCILLYIPIYNKANDSRSNSELPQAQEVSIAGWSIDTNRDVGVYVQPNNDTTVHEPKELCTKATREKKNTLLVLIIVYSSITNFDQRKAIRETWGDRVTYYKISKIFSTIRDKSSWKLDNQLARVLQIKQATNGDELDKRLEHNNDILPEFYINSELDKHIEAHYNYESLMNMGNDLKFMQDIDSKFEDASIDNVMPDFKVVFMLGLPANDNDIAIKTKVEEEVERYGDVIQELFVDTYSNLTMKSVMMLKWITKNCNESVRYILKTDDDSYINVPNLVANLQQRSKEYDDKIAKGNVLRNVTINSLKQDEHLLMGYLYSGEKPVRNSSNKWYSPRYMYSGDLYPDFLSGTGYVLSTPTARALYKAALTMPYFHLEDVYITGFCARRAKPSIVPRYGFTYEILRGDDTCCAHNYVITHRVNHSQMRILHQSLLTVVLAERCERVRLFQTSFTQWLKYWIYYFFT